MFRYSQEMIGGNFPANSVGYLRNLYCSSARFCHIEQQCSNAIERTDVPMVRQNPLKIQMLPDNLHKTIFSGNPSIKRKQNFALSIKHLKERGLWGKKLPDIKYPNLDLPPLEGPILEHYEKLALEQISSYKELIQGLIKEKLPVMPEKWELRKGWTQYCPTGLVSSVPFPPCSKLVFDTEVCMEEGSNPTLACAASNNYWYLWCSDSLVAGANVCDPSSVNDLVPFGLRSAEDSERIIAGHHVSFDRAAIKEMYLIDKDKTRFLDTMSLHIAVRGFIEEQHLIFKKFAATSDDDIRRPPWMYQGCPNGLKDLYKFYCKKELLKESRDLFVKGSLEDIKNNFNDLATYCAKDVLATHEVLCKVYPLYENRCPHPASLSGMLEMGTTYLPVSENWRAYITRAEQEYVKECDKLYKTLVELTIKNLDFGKDDQYKTNLWLWNLDWNIPKSKVKKLPGHPAWYRKLCAMQKGDHVVPLKMSTGLQIVPKLLRLSWKGYPLHQEKGKGWGYLIPTFSLESDISELEDKHPTFPYETFVEFLRSNKEELLPRESHKNKPMDIGIEHVQFVRLPHKDGVGANVGDPLGKSYFKYLKDGSMKSSVDEGVNTLLGTNRKISYWTNNRERISSQIVKWLKPEELNSTVKNSNESKRFNEVGVILPQLVTAGTVTRRAVEKTWMTASNPYTERIGSELKSMIEAPPGYHFVGADVDSQELWIAALLGDAQFNQEHGATPIGYMTLMGNRADGTDLHSYTAKTSGISRDHAKILNYGRIYGAGRKFIEQLLKEFNSKISDEECHKRANRLLFATKGRKGFELTDYGKEVVRLLEIPYDDEPVHTRFIKQVIEEAENEGTILKKTDIVNTEPIWTGGSESSMFNCLEGIARSGVPRTPVLNCAISKCLEHKFVEENYMPSRINWVVQSSAVDFLHLMLTTMQWLIKEYSINARFCISIHDEVRYLVASEDRYRAALALHITNLLTRSFIAKRVGIDDLPQSVAFFSGVDVDKVIRKEPTNECITPSNPQGMTEGLGISQGECLNIYQVIEKTQGKLQKNSESNTNHL